MKTTSVAVMNLCIPCQCHCHYCLLSYDDRITGVDYSRSKKYARKFYSWLCENRPELSFTFGYGYSMEHPQLLDAIDFCRSIGSVNGEFLQFNGMKFRSEAELKKLLTDIHQHGVKLIDLTFYGTEKYHDLFAGRKGDFQLLQNTLAQTNKIGLDVSVSIALSHDNSAQINNLIALLQNYITKKITCFVPHSEGRGHLLDKARFSSDDYGMLNDNAKQYFDPKKFRTEREWLKSEFPVPEKRALFVTLTPENIDFFENADFSEAISYVESLDDKYHEALPSPNELAKIYGDPAGQEYYSQRDLLLKYQRKYIKDNNLSVYDINDERQCFSRRF